MVDRKALLFWALAGLLVSILLVQFNFVARENDSRLYTRFIKQLSVKPIGEFVAPRWNGMSPFAEKETPFVRDHLPGQYFLPVLLTKAGVPASHAHYIVNTFVRVIILILILKLALLVLPIQKAILAPLLIQLIPINLTYQLRSNHEFPLLLFTLLGILAISNFRVSRRLSYGLLILSLLGAFYIKGLAMAPLVPSFWLCYLFCCENKKDIAVMTFNYSLILLLIPLTALLFEFYFQSVTGVGFFNKYFEVQIYRRSIEASSSTFDILQKLKNLSYYFGRALSYTLPFSLGLLVLSIKKRHYLKTFYKHRLTRSLGLVVLVNIIFFSMSDRIASRYIFTSYYCLALLSIVMILDQFKISIKRLNIPYALDPNSLDT